MVELFKKNKVPIDQVLSQASGVDVKILQNMHFKDYKEFTALKFHLSDLHIIKNEAKKQLKELYSFVEKWEWKREKFSTS